MSTTVKGLKGEQLSRSHLEHRGYGWCQLDGIAFDETAGIWFCNEAKFKKIWSTHRNGITWYGTGLNQSQRLLRKKLYEQTGIRCLFTCYDSESIRPCGNSIHTSLATYYEGWLDELDASGEYVDINHPKTGTPIRIYSLDVLYKGEEAVPNHIVKANLKQLQ